MYYVFVGRLAGWDRFEKVLMSFDCQHCHPNKHIIGFGTTALHKLLHLSRLRITNKYKLNFANSGRALNICTITRALLGTLWRAHQSSGLSVFRIRHFCNSLIIMLKVFSQPNQRWSVNGSSSKIIDGVVQLCLVGECSMIHRTGMPTHRGLMAST